jgi:hypothetical protein
VRHAALAVFAVVFVALWVGAVHHHADRTMGEQVAQLTAAHHTDSLAASRAGRVADSVVEQADRMRTAYRARYTMAPLVAQVAALADTLAEARQIALAVVADGEAGADSLRQVMRRLAANGERQDSLTRTAIATLSERVVAAGRVITEDSLGLTALAASRDAERARAVAAERLVAGWRVEAARQQRQTMVWRGVAGVAAIIAGVALLR